jgi:hypothetical protein
MYLNYIHAKLQKIALKAVVCVVMLCPSESVSAKLDLPDGFERAALYEGIDPLLLYAIALKESKSGRNGYIFPSLFAIRDESGSRYFETQYEAERYLIGLIEAGQTNIDVGAMQINFGQHRDLVKFPELLLDPYFNFRISAKILKFALESAPGDLELGVGRYHHWREESRSRRYGGDVLKLYKQLIGYEKMQE